MRNYEEIKDLIVNRLGLKDSKTYYDWVMPYNRGDRVVTREDVELLSPDNVNNNDFWQLAGELFGIDAVSFTNYGRNICSIDEANRRNFEMARQSGALNFIDSWKHSMIPVLEIGPGFGNFKNYVQMNTAWNYTGVDAFPLIHGVVRCLPTGLMPDSILEKNFFVVYSCNVFQHLSAKQRTQYFKDVSKILIPGGVFIFNLIATFNPPSVETNHSEDGEMYLKHYGQFTNIPCYKTLATELSEYFDVISECHRTADNLFTFTCRSKKPLNDEKL